jgi:putative tryptophan/tyrosine transport system substrate-binding protein
MNRRDFITLLGGAAAAWPLAARAQQGEWMLRIAVVAGNMEADPEEQARISAFRRQLAGLGWLEGHSIRFDYRWAATDEDRIRSTVAELVSLKPDAILTQGTPLTVAAQQQTRTIPIVFTLVAEPLSEFLQIHRSVLRRACDCGAGCRYGCVRNFRRSTGARAKYRTCSCAERLHERASR